MGMGWAPTWRAKGVPASARRAHTGSRSSWPGDRPPHGSAGTQIAAASNRAIGRSCVNCHSQIHGTNHPAGDKFLR